MLERSTVNRNLALMKERGWVTTARTSPTGRAMSVAITDTGISAFTSASAAWRSAQASAAAMLGPAAASTLDQWLGLYAERRPATSKASATSAKNRRSSAKAAVPQRCRQGGRIVAAAVRRAVDEQGGVPGKWLATRPLYMSRWIRSSTSLLLRVLIEDRHVEPELG
jgi:hypothetical protein